MRADAVLLQASAALVATFVASAQDAIRAATRCYSAVALVAAQRAYHEAAARHHALAAALARQETATVPKPHSAVSDADVQAAAAAALTCHVRLQAALLQHADGEGCRSGLRCLRPLEPVRPRRQDPPWGGPQWHAVRPCESGGPAGRCAPPILGHEHRLDYYIADPR